MTRSMKAGVIESSNSASIRTMPVPSAGDGEVLVKLEYTGICTFERRIYEGLQKHIPFPLLGGHESTGTVVEAGSGTELTEGDRVALDLIFRCGVCYWCVRGQDNQCVRIYSEKLSWDGIGVIGGGFAEYVSVPAQKAFLLPNGSADARAALSEPLACVLNSVSKADLRAGDTVAVVGAGTMGCLHAIVLELYGCKVIMVDIDDRRLEFVRERFGVALTCNPTDQNPAEYARSVTEGRGVNAVFVTAPVAQAATQALEMAGKCASVVLFTSTHPPIGLQVDWNRLHYDEIRLTGSVTRTRENFRQATELVSRLNLAPLITRKISLEELPDELAKGMPTGANQRVVIDFTAQ